MDIGKYTLTMKANTISELGIAADKYICETDLHAWLRQWKNACSSSGRTRCKRAIQPLCPDLLPSYVRTSWCTFALCRAKSGLGSLDPPNARHKGSIGFVIAIVKTIIRYALTNLMLTRNAFVAHVICFVLSDALSQVVFPRARPSLRWP